jgi:hypothetical protein
MRRGEQPAVQAMLSVSGSQFSSTAFARSSLIRISIALFAMCLSSGGCDTRKAETLPGVWTNSGDETDLFLFKLALNQDGSYVLWKVPKIEKRWGDSSEYGFVADHDSTDMISGKTTKVFVLTQTMPYYESGGFKMPILSPQDSIGHQVEMGTVPTYSLSFDGIRISIREIGAAAGAPAHVLKKTGDVNPFGR